MNSPSENPYEAPQAIDSAQPDLFGDSIPQAQLLGPEVQIRPLRSVFKWLIICGISAAPSFFWGAFLGSHPAQLLGMACGILVFVALYACAECHPRVQQFLNRRQVRLTARIGYGTRIVITILLVGAYLDMFVGLIAVSISSALFGFEPGAPGPLGGSSTSGGLDAFGDLSMFSTFMITTIIQGILLNIVLGCYMLVVYVICRLSGSK